MLNLMKKPFNLSETEVKEVELLLAKLTTDEKIGQLFCLHGDYQTKEEIQTVISTYHPGAVMYRPGESRQIQDIHRLLQQISAVPLLLAANLEAGGDGIGNDGTFFGRAIQVAAATDPKHAYRLGKVAAVEGAAVGCNWSFAPVIDINYNFENPITNVRTFGSDANRVAELATEYTIAAQEEGVAVSIKHFPGDGVDNRDQHLLTSVNSLSTEEWDNTYGKVYQRLIDAGAKTVMAGHIMQPAYSKKINPSLADEEILPASLSQELLTGLLRNQLGFNGLIVTDATNMAGFASCGKRNELLPQAINAGCDMLLFTRDIDEDYKAIREAVAKNRITSKRLDEAVLRILATKFSLGLFSKETLVPEKEALKKLKNDQHISWAYELADASITLVKDTQQLLPLVPSDYKKVLIIVLGDIVSASGKPPVSRLFIEHLETAGFKTELFNEEEHKELFLKGKVSDITAAYDLVIYFANIKTASNQTTVRINWLPPMGVDVPWFVEEIPTVFISVANPYHLQDVPMIKTYINAYTANEFNPKVLVDKLIGHSPFKGKSPVDAFAAYWDAKR